MVGTQKPQVQNSQPFKSGNTGSGQTTKIPLGIMLTQSKEQNKTHGEGIETTSECARLQKVYFVPRRIFVKQNFPESLS